MGRIRVVQVETASKSAGSTDDAAPPEVEHEVERLRKKKRDAMAAASASTNGGGGERPSRKKARKRQKKRKGTAGGEGGGLAGDDPFAALVGGHLGGGGGPPPEAATEPNQKRKGPRLDGNELLDRWAANRASLPPGFSRILDPELDEEARGDLFELQDEEAQEKYAWAIPDERALDICAAFAPLIEIGAGAGYWARLLRDRGVDVTPYDRDVGAAARAAGAPGAAAWTKVERGGSEVLPKAHRAAALLLMFPDDLDTRGAKTPLSMACLKAFRGENSRTPPHEVAAALSPSPPSQTEHDVCSTDL